MMRAPDKPTRPLRHEYATFVPMATRWLDNDMYGHVNNAVYYSFFDTAVSRTMLALSDFDPHTSPIVGLLAETRCTYFASVAFPDQLEVGIRITRLGTSSVHYDLGVFKHGEDIGAARGAFVHVYVDRATQKPVPIPQTMRNVLQTLCVAQN